ncbi:glycosyl hydrolase family 28 protein [Parabacteroides sp. FAFU027]|uniref:glycosyl hydrolase family 28 protein n=1 Tax=Parabacteroides sp. FAFU027 TaxID=2922715 RepID=UPI0021D42998|nr:glycosyl hydrolase family 28 protein [Parabacteroides sp. FAFU027]
MNVKSTIWITLLYIINCAGLCAASPDIEFNQQNAIQRTVTLPTIPVGTFLITNYGAINSTTVDNTSAIQQAINACSTAGGGTVVIPAGTYLSGPLSMKNKVNLQISAGAVLKLLPYGSGNGTVAGTYPNSGTTNDYNDFIYGKNLNNIKISGTGTIEGQGSDWWTAYKANTSISRPCLIRFDGCSYVEITGITLQNAPNVHITIGKSGTNATISSVIIISPSTSPNTDGIDTWSPYVNILNCNIACGDDNIAMDSGSQYITVKNCTFGTGHGCSVGSYAANVGNIVVDSCSFSKTTSGIRLKTARDRGGVEQYFTYSNITMSGVTTPFYITSYYPKEPTSPGTDPAQAITSTTPTWQHINFQNITVTGSNSAGILWGLPEQSITDVVFDNVKISATTSMKAYYVKDLVFKNGSTITVNSGNALLTYSTNASGINQTTGKAISTGISENIASQVNCFPNPVKEGKLSITAPSNILSVTFLSLQGSKVKELICDTPVISTDLSDLPKGIYIVSLKLSDGNTSVQKVIIP